MLQREDYFKCKHCLRNFVQKIPEDFYSDTHWMCPECFSTYTINTYPLTTEDATRVREQTKDRENAEKWRAMQRSFSRPDQMRLDIAPAWDSRNVGQ